MAWKDHIDNDLPQSLRELVFNGFISKGGIQFAVTQKVIDGGKASLTADEMNVYEEQIAPALRALEEAKLDVEVTGALGLLPPATSGETLA